MKKVIFLAIISLFASSMAFGTYMKWEQVTYSRNPQGINKTYYLNTTDVFVLFAESKGSGAAQTSLYNASGVRVCAAMASGNMGTNWNCAWRNVTTPTAVSRFNFYAIFNEGLPIPSHTAAGFLLVSGHTSWVGSNLH